MLAFQGIGAVGWSSGIDEIGDGARGYIVWMYLALEVGIFFPLHSSRFFVLDIRFSDPQRQAFLSSLIQRTNYFFFLDYRLLISIYKYKAPCIRYSGRPFHESLPRRSRSIPALSRHVGILLPRWPWVDSGAFQLPLQY